MDKMNQDPDNLDEIQFQYVPLNTLFGEFSTQAEEDLNTESPTPNGHLRPLEGEEGILWLQGKKSLACIDCGLCCFKYEIDNVPGYSEGIKPICENCKHLIPPTIQSNRQWEGSKCKIYQNRPQACIDFRGNVPPFVYEAVEKGEKVKQVPCAEGIMYWTKLMKIYRRRLPEHIAHYFPKVIRALGK